MLFRKVNCGLFAVEDGCGVSRSLSPPRYASTNSISILEEESTLYEVFVFIVYVVWLLQIPASNVPDILYRFCFQNSNNARSKCNHLNLIPS